MAETAKKTNRCGSKCNAKAAEKKTSVVKHIGLVKNDPWLEPYEDAIKAQEEINKVRTETLNEDVEVELRTITPDELPTIILEHED